MSKVKGTGALGARARTQVSILWNEQGPEEEGEEEDVETPPPKPKNKTYSHSRVDGVFTVAFGWPVMILWATHCEPRIGLWDLNVE